MLKKVLMSAVVIIAMAVTSFAAGPVERWKTELPFDFSGYDDYHSYTYIQIFPDVYGGCVLCEESWIACYDKTGKMYYEYKPEKIISHIVNDGRMFVFATLADTRYEQNVISLTVNGKTAEKTEVSSSSQILYQMAEGNAQPVNKKGFFTINREGAKGYIVYSTFK